MAAEGIREEINRILQGALQMIATGNLRSDEQEYVQFQLGRVERILSLCMQANVDVDRRVLSLVSEAKYLLSETFDTDQQQTGHTGYQSEKVFEGDRGRPRYNISKEQLSYFIDFGFTAPQMSKMLGVSESTIRRHIHDLISRQNVSQTF